MYVKTVVYFNFSLFQVAKTRVIDIVQSFQGHTADCTATR